MNFRNYLQLLRPVGSQAFIVQYGFFLPWFLLKDWWLVDWWLGDHLISVAIWLASVVGVVLAGAAHDPMHLTTIQLLPGGLRWLRNTTVVSLLIFSAVLVAGLALAGSQIPFTAAFGLVVGSMALPCASRHRRFSGTITFLLVSGSLIYLAARGTLLPAMIAAPYAFLGLGVTAAAASIFHGFSRRYLPERLETRFRAPQGMFSVYRTNSRGGQRARFFRRPHSRPGLDWNVATFNGSTWWLMKALRHSVSGLRRHGAVFNWMMWVVVPTTACALFPFLGHVTGDLSTTEFWRSLAQLSSEPGDDNNFLIWTLYPIFAGVLAQVSLRAPLAFPVSRDRLARAMFGLSLIHWAAAWIATTLPILLVSVVGQFKSGIFLPYFGVPVLFAFAGTVALLPYLVFNFPIRFVRPIFSFSNPDGIFLVLLLLTYLLLLIALSIERHRWLPLVLTPVGLTLLVLATAASVRMRWIAIRNSYRVRDLTQGISG